VHRLAVLRQKKNKDLIANRKVEVGYSLELFNHFVIKNGRSYYFVVDDTFVDDKDKGAWERLRDHVNYSMLEVDLADEFLIIGTFFDDDGVVRRHASTFIKIKCGRPNKEAVIIHLDSNLPLPQCSDRKLYTAKETTQLNWKEQFQRYTKICVYTMGERYLYDNKEIQDRDKFCKDVIEGRPARAPADESEVHQEMSQRGK
jgi:hypothetical protein